MYNCIVISSRYQISAFGSCFFRAFFRIFTHLEVRSIVVRATKNKHREGLPNIQHKYFIWPIQFIQSWYIVRSHFGSSIAHLRVLSFGQQYCQPKCRPSRVFEDISPYTEVVARVNAIKRQLSGPAVPVFINEQSEEFNANPTDTLLGKTNDVNRKRN